MSDGAELSLRGRGQTLEIVRAHNATVMRARKNILCEENFQSSHVSLFGSPDKCLQKTPLLLRTDGRAPAIGDVFTGTPTVRV